MKKILFRPSENWASAITDAPTPMSKLIPNWYKEMLVYREDKNSNYKNRKLWGKTIKTCAPVLDSISSGYALTLPVSVNTFINQDGHREFTWNRNDWVPIGKHSEEQINKYPVPVGYESLPFKFNNVWGIQLPIGYSLLLCHPLGRHDLPFYSFHGMVDSDLHYVPILIPFVMKEGWEGVIEKGTIIAQVIPIKRDSWQGEIRDISEFNAHMQTRKILSHVEKWYKKFIWVKKTYN